MVKRRCKLDVQYAYDGDIKNTSLDFHEPEWTWSSRNQSSLCAIIEVREHLPFGSVILVSVQEVPE